MESPFEYDVFISFSSQDEPIVKPVWQELCSSGLRVFWSDATLKEEVGNSWFQVIQHSLELSKHMLLICTSASLSSKWVQMEYQAFLDSCYTPGLRRLIPLLAQGYLFSDLPIFLRQLEGGRLEDPKVIQKVIASIGGFNLENLKRENASLKQQVVFLQEENALWKGKYQELLQKSQEEGWESEPVNNPPRQYPKPNFNMKPPICNFVSQFNGDLLFDDSFAIDSPDGEFLGECGVGVGNKVETYQAKGVNAFEIWLFDKTDIMTRTKILLTPSAANDAATKKSMAAKGDLVVAEPDGCIELETAHLKVTVDILNLDYVGKSLTFKNITFSIEVWQI